MKLLTKELRKKLPPLYSTENNDEAKSVCKFFTPDSNFTWHVFEFDGEDTMFGFVEGLDKEWGYFSLGELIEVRGPLGLKVERDMYYTPKTKKELNERK